MKAAHTYLTFIFASVITFLVCAISLQYYLHTLNLLPAAPVSASLSFNEKVSWIAGRGAIPCTTLASGSSITLNNLNSRVLASRVGKGNYINISSWGMTLIENYEWISKFIQLCVPKELIIISSHNDFRNISTAEKRIDFNEALTAIKNGEEKRDYLDITNIYYTLENLKNVDDERKTRSKHDSLFFDSNGGIPLDYLDWSNGPQWDKGLVNKDKIDKDQYKALASISHLAKSHGIRFIFVQSPIRHDARLSMQSFLNTHTRKISTIANNNGFEFYNYLFMPGMVDKLFVDKTHLNAGGSKLVTNQLVADMSRSQEQK